MLSAKEQQSIDDSRAVAWFAVKIAFGGLLIHYTLGSLAAIMFFFGWWWGETRRKPIAADEPGNYDDFE
jgi:hypothetical protein